FTQESQIWPIVCDQVKSQLSNTPNFGPVNTPPLGATQMALPTVTLPDGSTFNATLSQNGEMIDVKVYGAIAGVESHRTLKVSYARATRASAIFDYGVASKSPISMGGK